MNHVGLWPGYQCEQKKHLLRKKHHEIFKDHSLRVIPLFHKTSMVGAHYLLMLCWGITSECSLIVFALYF